MNGLRTRSARVAVAATTLLVSASRSVVGQVQLCEGAELFMAAEIGMAVATETEDVDDWRTDRLVPGCRATGAGLTRRSLRDEAAGFFERLRASGWVRTPDPQDAPNESSLRFRKDGVDCLFSFYSGGLLGTEAEDRVDDARVPGPGERRFNFLVQCVPAMDAAPRDTAVVRPAVRESPNGRHWWGHEGRSLRVRIRAVRRGFAKSGRDRLAAVLETRASAGRRGCGSGVNDPAVAGVNSGERC